MQRTETKILQEIEFEKAKIAQNGELLRLLRICQLAEEEELTAKKSMNDDLKAKIADETSSRKEHQEELDQFAAKWIPELIEVVDKMFEDIRHSTTMRTELNKKCAVFSSEHVIGWGDFGEFASFEEFARKAKNVIKKSERMKALIAGLASELERTVIRTVIWRCCCNHWEKDELSPDVLVSNYVREKIQCVLQPLLMKAVKRSIAIVANRKKRAQAAGQQSFAGMADQNPERV